MPTLLKYFAAGAATLAMTQFSLMGGAMAAETTTAGPTSPAAVNRSPSPPPGPYHELLPAASPSAFKGLAPSSGANGVPGVSSQTGAVNAPPPPNHGAGFAPYTTARVAVQVQGVSSPAANDPVTSYPFRPTGKLYFLISGSTYVCTASMIKPGVLLTAAHCVFSFGANSGSGFYSNWTFCPALTSVGQPYGCYTGVQARILTTYYNGTDVCTQTGVVCNDDMATITLAPDSNNKLPGSKTGWYAYSWNGYSFHPFQPTFGNANVAEITQLGYPQAIDSGVQMQRTDAPGWKVTSGSLLNTEIGSAQTGGSSGGPWMVNFGTPSVYGSGSSTGQTPAHAIVGVTSWGYTDITIQIQGASYFGQNSQYSGNYGAYGLGNIGLLVSDTCSANPTLC